MHRLAILLILVLLAACESMRPAPVGQFVLFFRTNEAVLTPEAKEIVGRIVKAAQERHPARIVVEGKADGNTPHDQELADKRAGNAVKALVEGGIDTKFIESHASTTTETGVAAHQVVVRFE